MPPGGQKRNYLKNRLREVDGRAMPIGKIVLFVILPFGNPKRHRSRETWPHFDQALYKSVLAESFLEILDNYIITRLQFILCILQDMAIPAVEFSRKGLKLERFLAKKATVVKNHL